MMTAVVLLLGSAVAIYLACELFVNGVEWFGRKLAIGETATGTILAAFGTALPESVVTFVAVALGDDAAQKDIGVGAALGGPLALSTIAYAVVGLSLLAWGTRAAPGERVGVSVDEARLARDQGWFLVIFLIKVALGTVAFAVKPVFGLAFLAAYAWYVRGQMRLGDGGGEAEDLEPLRLRPRDADPPLGWVALQTAAAVLVIFVASRVFVNQLEAVGTWLGLSPQLTALLFSHIATELPETMNALIWVRQGKERLALANISGAMMIQATIPTAFGLFFTPWLLDAPLFVGAAVTMAATGFLYLAFRAGPVSGRRLSQVGCLYGVFAGVVALVR